MNKFRKVFCVILCCVMTLSLASCGGGASGSAPSGTKAAATTASVKTTAAGAAVTSAAATTAAAAAAANSPIDITVRSVASSGNTTPFQSKDSPIGQIVYQKTGVNFKFDYTVGDENEAISLMIAGGDLADIVCPHYNIAPFVAGNVALDLTGYIEKNAPLYKERLGKNWNMMVWSAADSGRYYLSDPEQTNDQFDGKNWFMLQHAVPLEENFPKLITLQDYENAIKTYKDKYPTIDGMPTIGLSLITASYLWILSLTNPAMIAAGTQSSGEYYVDPQTHKVTYRVLRDEETEYFRWLNHMYNIGLLDPESFTQTEDQYKEKIAQGRVLATTNMGWYTTWGPEQTLRQDGKNNRCYGAYPIVLKEGIQNSSFSGPRSLSGAPMLAVVTTKCQHPDQLLAAINYLVSDEGQILNNWGQEGVQYTLDANGKRVPVKAEVDKRASDPNYGITTGQGVFGFWGGYNNGSKDSSGQYWTPASKENIIASETDVEKQVLAGYGKQTWADFFPQPDTFPMRMWPGESGGNTRLDADSDGAVAFNKVQDVVKTDVIKAVVGKPEEFDANWDAFKADMKANGVDTFTQAIEQNNIDLMKLWGMPFDPAPTD